MILKMHYIQKWLIIMVASGAIVNDNQTSYIRTRWWPNHLWRYVNYPDMRIRTRKCLYDRVIIEFSVFEVRLYEACCSFADEKYGGKAHSKLY